MTLNEALDKAIKETEAKITDAKKVMPFPMYLTGVLEGLQWSLRIIKKQTE